MEIEKIIKSLTVEEKIKMLSGKDSWHTLDNKEKNIRSIRMQDGPHGLRIPLDEGGSIPATCFPPASTFACSFDKELIKQIGSAIASECINYNVDILLGPGFNIKRSPLCGRNFEYYSEDPFVCGELAGAFVDGVQEKGVGACIKHYAVNSQENYRLTIDSVVDERALREIYLSSFERIIKKNKPYALMASYNRINGEYGCENSHLLKELLRKKWEYNGLVMSDWGATNNIVNSIKNGMDLEMPSSFKQSTNKLFKAYENKEIGEEEINNAIRHILLTLENVSNKVDKNCDYQKNHLLAKKVANESFVLMKNNSVLPLTEDEDVLFIGGLVSNPIMQGGGSSKIKMIKIDSLLESLKEKKNFHYVLGYENVNDYDKKIFKEAINEAKKHDKIVLFVGQSIKDVTEGVDRVSMYLSKVQEDLIFELSKLGKKIIVVLQTGSAIYMPWVDRVDGILNTHLLGQAGASAVVETLYGINNPSGKLTESYAKNDEDTIWKKYYHKGNNAAYYQESIFVGYRYYDTFSKDILFPFGYGLSYSKFEYSNLKIERKESSFEISFDLTNNSEISGKEIVQIYIKKDNSKIYRSIHELKGFDKIYLTPYETKKVCINISDFEFSYYDIDEKDFVIEDGEYVIEVGASSRDIKLQEKVYLQGKKDNFSNTSLLSYYNGTFSFEDFKKLIGKEFSLLEKTKKEIDENSTVEDLRKRLIGKIIAKIIVSKSKGQQDAEDIFDDGALEDTLNFMPLRALSNMSDGMLNEDLMYAIIEICNGHLIRGIRKLRGK